MRVVLKKLVHLFLFCSLQVLICLEILGNGDLRSYLQGLKLRYVYCALGLALL